VNDTLPIAARLWLILFWVGNWRLAPRSARGGVVLFCGLENSAGSMQMGRSLPSDAGNPRIFQASRHGRLIKAEVAYRAASGEKLLVVLTKTTGPEEHLLTEAAFCN